MPNGDIVIYQYGGLVEKTTRLLMEFLEKDTWGQVPKVECSCKVPERIMTRKYSENADVQIEHYTRTELITDILTQFDLLELTRPAFSTKMNRHICSTKDIKITNMVDKLKEWVATPLEMGEKDRTTVNPIEDEIRRVRTWYLLSAPLPRDFGKGRAEGLQVEIESIGEGEENSETSVNNWLDTQQLSRDLKDCFELKDFAGSQMRDRMNRGRRALFEEMLSLKQIQGRLNDFPESEYGKYTTGEIREDAELQLERQSKVFLITQMLFTEFYNPLCSMSNAARLLDRQTRAINQTLCKCFPESPELLKAVEMFNRLTRFIGRGDEEEDEVEALISQIGKVICEATEGDEIIFNICEEGETPTSDCGLNIESLIKILRSIKQ